jgi:hypothetical protein
VWLGRRHHGSNGSRHSGISLRSTAKLEMIGSREFTRCNFFS